MNFKDLQVAWGNLGNEVRTQIARNNPLQRQDTKAISMWIFEERNDLAAMRTMAHHRRETNKTFEEWLGEEQKQFGEDATDLEDVGGKLHKLLDKMADIEQEFSDKHQQYRQVIKSIRKREEQLSDAREKKRTIKARIYNLSKTNAKSPKLQEFQKELDTLAQETHDAEMEIGDFKRFAFREAFYLRFNALDEFAQKMAIIAGFGKYIVDLVDVKPTPAGQQHRQPYTKGPEAATILADALVALDGWKPVEGDERTTLAAHTFADKFTFYEDAAPLTEEDIKQYSEGKGKGKVADRASKGDLKTSAEAPPLPPRLASQHSLDEGHGSSVDPNAPPPAYIDTRHEPGLSSAPPSSLLDQPTPSLPPRSEQPNILASAPPIKENVAEPPHQYEDKHAVEEEAIDRFQSPYQAHASASASHTLTNAPRPSHQQLPGMQPPSQSPYLSSSWNQSWHQSAYHQLYRQMTQRQRHAPPQRPYAEFQQQFAHFHQDPPRPHIDAGGFRIPTSQVSSELSAEDEKRVLAEHYAAEDETRRAALRRSSTTNQAPAMESPPAYEGPKKGYPEDKKEN
ncbi:hypothetical protein DFQ28_000656 [Apophysomyces sp. BC1034]|nr:hypothetical protein DFQ30_000669 [Apophysomyces sp. BC1015]KAG0178243.1 hypothetical protein DFQ29_003769 [Apophysomyces sp. BC1021]KAG0191261.1 hypothetical protein DFQ28_000656 [Apophysomyces sp. BC1034]